MSAVASVSTSGVLETASPRAFAAFTSMWLKPTPKLAEDLRPERLRRQHLGGELVGHGGQERVGGPERLLQLVRRERLVVRVERARRSPSATSASTSAGSFRVTTTTGRLTPSPRFLRAGRASAFATVVPSSAGLGATVRPSDRMISAFSAAVSPNAEMMAPAWPMRRPLGAVSPAT